MADTFERLKNIFEEVFIDEYELTPQTTAADIDEWDSMAHINLVKAMEDEFKCKFTLDEMATASNLEEMVTIIDNKK
jgi:acyl carrier protein